METKEKNKEIANEVAIMQATMKIEGFCIEALSNLVHIEELRDLCDQMRDVIAACDVARRGARSRFNNLTE